MGICLPKLFVVAATLINWDFRYILNGPSQAWVGDYFYLNWAVRRILKVVFCVADFFFKVACFIHIYQSLMMIIEYFNRQRYRTF